MGVKFSGIRMFRTVASPIGLLTLVIEDGALVGAYTQKGIHNPPESHWGRADESVAADVVEQLGEYFVGQRTVFDFDTPIRPAGTGFQQDVWRMIAGIGFGDTISYGQIADVLGKPSASRAVGSATGKNPLSIIVPCHRVVGSDNSLSGYAGGLEAKKWLLNHESSLDAQRPGYVIAGRA